MKNIFVKHIIHRVFCRHPKLLLLAMVIFGLSTPTMTQNLSEDRWVDSVYNQLTPEQRVGQLIMARANQPDKPYDPALSQLIQKYNLGGVTFFKGSPQSQLYQTNKWQQEAKTPLLISIDAEWGLAMRLPGTVSYPFQMTLGAIQNDSIIAAMGYQIAAQCQRLGIHINFAPVVDVNSNAANPVIGMRSYGEQPEQVTAKGIVFARAMQQGGVVATAKHFPGHGDTQNDSHYTLPVLNHSRAHFDSVELVPFKKMIESGVDAIMTAHLHIPALDATPNLPSSLSYPIVTGILKNEMGFKGLIITDGLDMKGVTSVQPSGKIELSALMAGNDILLLPENIPLAIQTILDAVADGSLSMVRIEESCKKILHYKYKVGLNTYRPSNIEGLSSDLAKPEYQQLNQQLFNESVTLLRNNDDGLPLVSGTDTLALLTIGKETDAFFKKELVSKGIVIQSFTLNKNADKDAIAALIKKLRPFKKVIVNLQNTSMLAAKKYGITDGVIQLMQSLSKDKHIIFNLFASPYALDLFAINAQYKAILIGYQDRDESVQAAAQILTGQLEARGKLPVSLKTGFKAGEGLTIKTTKTVTGLLNEADKKKTDPPAIKNSFFDKIDSIAQDGILKKAYPGCQIVALHNGRCIYNRSFGFLTYDSTQPVTEATLYDLASLTKILATTPAVMRLYEDSSLFMSQTLGDFLPYLNKTDKGQLRIYDILAHQSGLDGWIPFYLKTIKNKNLDPSVYAKIADADHPYRIADSIYMHRNYRYAMFQQIGTSKLKVKEYRYSDMGFIILPLIVELLTNQPFEEYVYDNIYRPLALDSITYQPLKKFQRSRIAPTEDDQDFRKQLLQGDVHDPGAAMLGGIAGHAGLFGNAHQVALLMQMFLNKGSLNGVKIFEPQTLNYFTRTHFKNNRRGLGFDKPPLDPKETSRSMAKSASPESFGHTGFTGTFAWADPKNKLVVVFLSNRVYPNAKTNLLAKMNIRPQIHELFYQYVQHIQKK